MNTPPSPCFVLDEALLRKNLALIQKVGQEADIDVILAFKGFAMWSVLPLIGEYITGATASSLHEALLCREFMKTKAHTYCVAYTESEFDEVADNSCNITFNSLAQLEKFKQRALRKNLSVGLRVNPEYSDVETALYNPASPNSRLGITSDELKHGLPEGVEGLHMHVLCESDSYALEHALEALEHKFGHLLADIKWLNVGGGHLLTKEGYNTRHLVKLLIAFKTKHDLTIIMEPGSAFAWQTGDLYTTVLDVVQRNGVNTAIIDASFTCHMPDCLEMPYRPSVLGGSDNSEKFAHQYRLGGVSCLAGDFLEAYSFEKELVPEDVIIFQDMMHYTMVKSTTFNGIQHPSIGIKRESGDFELIKTFGYEDYKNRLS